MKAYTMPVNLIVVIVIAVIVLIALVVFFSNVWNPSTAGVNVESLKNTGCNRFISTGCGNPENIELEDIDNDPLQDKENLLEICNEYYGCKKSGTYSAGPPEVFDTEAQKTCCRNVCGC